MLTAPRCFNCAASTVGRKVLCPPTLTPLRKTTRANGPASPRERVGSKLELHHLARRPLAPLHVERRAGADGGPETTALPSAVGIVDAAVQPFRVVAQRVGDAEDDPFAVLQD